MFCEDRSHDWQQAVDNACRHLYLSPEEARRHKQQLLMRPPRDKSQFATVAEGVDASIQQLREFIATTKRDYISSGKLTEQAKDEVEEHVGQLVATITQSLDALKNGVLAAQQAQDGGQPLVNEQTAAHLHGTVLVLVELLHSVTAAFDKCRAVRYQQSLAREMRSHRRAPAVKSSSRQQAGLPPDKLGAPDMNGHSSSSGGGGGVQQQAQQYDTTTQHILADLRTTAQQAQQVEASMRHISTLNQMVSTAVMQQADMIEQLYNDAVEATHHVSRGNVELRKTIALNRSSRNWVMVLTVVAGLLLLFVDWFYS